MFTINLINNSFGSENYLNEPTDKMFNLTLLEIRKTNSYENMKQKEREVCKQRANEQPILINQVEGYVKQSSHNKQVR